MSLKVTHEKKETKMMKILNPLKFNNAKKSQEIQSSTFL